jgi:hypothetical protein
VFEIIVIKSYPSWRTRPYPLIRSLIRQLRLLSSLGLSTLQQTLQQQTRRQQQLLLRTLLVPSKMISKATATHQVMNTTTTMPAMVTVVMGPRQAMVLQVSATAVVRLFQLPLPSTKAWLC